MDRVQRSPVRITRYNRVAGVVVSAQDYEAMRRFYAERLRGRLAEGAASATARGLTQADLERLLAHDA